MQFVLILTVWRVTGFFDYEALAILTLVLVGYVAFFALARPRRGSPWILIPLGAVPAAVLLVDLAAREALLYARKPQRPAFLLLAAASVVLLVAGWLVRRRGGLLLTLCAVIIFGAFLATQLHRSPSPIMDTWVTNSEATEAFLHGRNPYGREYANVYEGTHIKSPDYKMLFNYLPGLILHYVPGTVLGGDIRWTNLVGIVFGLLLFAVCARPRKDEQRGGPHPVTRAAAVVLFWYHGGQVLVVEQAWPEAWLLVYVGLALWTWRRSTLVPAVALVLALTLKQTAWFCAPFFLALSVKERRWGLIAAVAAGVTAIVLPFFLWNPGAFVQNVVVHFFEIAPRTNALSWSAACLQDAPVLFPYAYRLSYVVYAAALGCLVLRLRHLRGRDAVLETHVWMTVGLLGLFLFLKQSFFNYYYVVGGLLAFAFCLAGRSREAETGAVTDSAPLGAGA